MGWKVIRIAPTGELAVEIKMPIWLPTSCAFGGKDMDELYITTGWVTMSAEQRKEQPYSGDLLRIRTKVKGILEPKFKG
jgi:sugar lactone lactonase YvrE